jgi:hypothetical protein
MNPLSDPTGPLRQTLYLLVGTVAVFVMLAKIVGAENVFEPSRYAPPTAQSFGAARPDRPTRTWPTSRPEPAPFLSSNDKSRWATIRALADNGTYIIGKRSNITATEPPFQDTGIIFENDYQSLDKVMNPATGEYYSSKPPLLSTLLAGEYWLLKKAFGWDIVQDKWLVVCTILITVNLLPFALYLLLLAKLVERFGNTDFSRLFPFTVGALGTFLLSFGGTLNNHNPAAYCALFMVYPLLRNWSERVQVGSPGNAAMRVATAETPGELATSGFFAGLIVCFELPSLALAVGILLPLVWMRPKRTLCYFVPLLLVPIGSQFVCNKIALGTFLPAYSDFGGPWYNFAGSHWQKWDLVKAGRFVPGIDFNQEPTLVYAFHLLIGHHGWFSLTPVFLVSLLGLVRSAASGGVEAGRLLGRTLRPTDRVWTPTLLATLTLLVSGVVFTFYLTRTQSYNYGGNTSGPRWFFWLIPFWTLAAVAGIEFIPRGRWWRIMAAGLLGFSVLSVFYPAWNPWRSPWVQQLCERAGWVSYELPPVTIR